MAEFRFATLLQLAIDEREEAANRLQAAQGRWLAARAKLEQVESFRADYRARLTSNGQSGMTVTQWRDFQLFLGKLDAAADQQAEDVARQEASYQQALAAWQECEKKVKGFETLKERHEATEQRKELRREQKMLDEFNTSRPRPPRE
ncbi:flagellar FliJ protein [Formivibrio citricus]|uniref:Flagellar FliJ protein n=1 Tax=Formivibrio citricus TaxID=83765 RepID=A0A1I5B9N3_9NEIS|nr:flagellar export protein FliJ [Formivibrio citricus]SFN71350.1 flagellar FliJ protein [Formivibrio citricus]